MVDLRWYHLCTYLYIGELDHQVKSPECGEGGAQSEVAVGTSNISTKGVYP